MLCFIVVSSLLSTVHGDSVYYGAPVGNLSTLQHQLSGAVYVVDSKRLRLREFNYDGKGPAAFFWIGIRGTSGPVPDQTGLAIPDEKNSTKELHRYVNDDVILYLPGTATVNNIVWLSVWCQRFAVNFGHVIFPESLQVPKPTVIGQFRNAVYGITSDDVTVNDSRTVSIKNLTNNSNQTDMNFVAGNDTSSPDTLTGLQQQQQQTTSADNDVYLSLPGAINIYDVQFIAIYSYSSKLILAQINITANILVPPYINKV